jgi:large subunit ribosomal protein L14e
MYKKKNAIESKIFHGEEKMIELGRVCIKLAGRDAGELAVIIDKIDKNFVKIDGNVRRRKCNLTHLEPLDKVVKIKKDASTADVHKAMSVLKLPVKEQKKVKRTKKEVISKKKTTKVKK